MNSREATALAVPWRTVTCRKCKRPTPVLELPAVFLDPAVFVCGPCMRPKT